MGLQDMQSSDLAAGPADPNAMPGVGMYLLLHTPFNTEMRKRIDITRPNLARYDQ